jgi:hypothetical protein
MRRRLRGRWLRQRRGRWRGSRDGRRRDHGRWTALRACTRGRGRRLTASRAFVLLTLVVLAARGRVGGYAGRLSAWLVGMVSVVLAVAAVLTRRPVLAVPASMPADVGRRGAPR